MAAGEGDLRPEWRRPARPRPQSKTIRELFEPYKAHHDLLKLRQGYAANGLMSLNSVVNQIGDQEAAKLDVRKWRDGLLTRNSIATANRKLTAVRSFFEWAVQQGELETNPATEVKILPLGNVASKRARALTHDQAERLRDALCNRGDRLNSMWLVAFNTGLRKAELERLSWGDISRRDGKPTDLDRDLIDAEVHGVRVLVRQSKTGKPRTVSLNREARTALAFLAGAGCRWPDLRRTGI